MGCKLYANEVRSRLTVINCCPCSLVGRRGSHAPLLNRFLTSITEKPNVCGQRNELLTGNQSVPHKVFMLFYANLCKLYVIPEKIIFCFNSVKYDKPTS